MPGIAPLAHVNKTQEKGVPVPFWKKLLGVHLRRDRLNFGLPSEVALARMGADAKSPPELRRNYKNVLDCPVRIVKEEGPPKQSAGGAPTIIRATLLRLRCCAPQSLGQLHKTFPSVFHNKEGIP